jgi:hypothetical protein
MWRGTMSFKYDFDMFSVVPEEMKQDFENAFDELGMGGQSNEQVALFRDPALAVALQNADDEVRQLFLNAGFGLNVYDSGAPEGCYLANDEAGRSACISRFAQSIVRQRDVLSQNWNGFDIEEFLDYVTQARPIEADDIQIPPPVVAKSGSSSLIRLASIGVVAARLVIGFSTGVWSF